MDNHTPGPWAWQEANHTGDDKTSHPRSLVSLSYGDRHPILIPAAKIAASQAHIIDLIALEIHGSKHDEALIAAAPDVLEACKTAVAAMRTPSQGRIAMAIRTCEYAMFKAGLRMEAT